MSLAHEHRDTWARKPVLRAIYADYYRRIGGECVKGNTLEIGSGSGNLSLESDTVVRLDIQKLEWIDVVSNAEKLPFVDGCFHNIVMVDVLHHLPNPTRFFEEAVRVLASGGKVILVEPAITPLSWFAYHYLHSERVDMSVDPLDASSSMSGNDPYDSNQALPTLLFHKFQEKFQADFPQFRMIRKEFLSLWCYPLSGGLQAWNLLPAWLVRPLLALEGYVLPVIGRIAGFRLFVVLQKT